MYLWLSTVRAGGGTPDQVAPKFCSFVLPFVRIDVMRKKRSKRVSLVGNERIPPTPETRKKLKPDPIWQLTEELGAERLQAVHEIREAVDIISAPFKIRIQKWERQDRSFGESESERVVRVQQRYNSWVDKMTERKVPVGPALDMIVEGMGIREIENNKQWRHGSFKSYFFDALDIYGEIAGWKKLRR